MTDQLIFEILSPKKQIIEWGKVLPEDLNRYQINGSSLFYSGLKKYGHIIIQHIYHNGYDGWLSQFLISEPTSVFIKSFGESVMLYYMVSGQVDYRSKLQHNKAVKEYMNLIPACAIDHELIFNQTGNCSIFQLFIPATKLKLFQATFPTIGNLLKQVVDAMPETILDQDISDNGRMGGLIQRLLEVKSIGLMPRGESVRKMEDIIIAGLDLYSNRIWINNALPIYAVQPVENVKTHLLKSIYDLKPPSLRMLSKIAGLSEKSLEVYFKIAYGATMFDFFQTARMEAIFRRLLLRDYYLQNIAEDFNYEDYSSFSSAVKRRFGKSPRDIQKESDSNGES